MSSTSIENEEDFLILIADDVPKNVQLIGKILDNRGYRIAAVTNGGQVVRAVQKHKPDLILLDIMMPGKTGFEVCKELKEDSELAEIPVIFLTARSEEEDIIKGLKLGGADYVTKPFNSGELLARIRTHLSLKQARDQIVQQQQQLEHLTETREKLYSIIAHDLKNALFGITGMAEIVEQELADMQQSGELLENMQMITKSANSALLILENLLSWTRLQTDNLGLNPEKFKISTQLSESISLYETQANNKQVTVHIEVPDQIKNMQIYADKQMLSTVLRNLISNAIKFSNRGDEVTVSVSNNQEGLTIAVKDQGIGMPEEVRESVFNPEERPKRTGTEQEVGTGLGLMLCKEFVEAHNGDIRVESEPGEGSEFKFTIPRNDARQTGRPGG